MVKLEYRKEILQDLTRGEEGREGAARTDGNMTSSMKKNKDLSQWYVFIITHIY